jgi:hypothetical protein
MTVDGGTKLSELDSKKKSASEAFVNSFGGYPIGYGVGIVILPLSTGWIQEDPYMANIVITGVYATVSFVRSYFLRNSESGGNPHKIIAMSVPPHFGHSVISFTPNFFQVI